MGSFKLIFIILPFLTFGQQKAPTPREWIAKHDDVAHFYGSCGINELTYQIQGLLFPKKKEVHKVLFANLVTTSCIFIKERYDVLKAKPTGWSWADIFIGLWAILIYDIVNICRFDYKNRTKDGYYK